MTASPASEAGSRPTAMIRHIVVAALLCVLTLTVYFQVRNHDFIAYDDPIYVSENPQLAAGFSRQAIVRAFSEAYETNWIPLTWISYHLDHAIFGLDPAGYHLINVALHAVAAILLYCALFAMTRTSAPSAFVAAVFAVHPLHVESVAWVAERKDTLSGVFFMLSLLAYARYVRRPSIAAQLAVVLAYALGLLAKPMLVSLPFVLLLLDYWPLGRLASDGSGRIEWRRLAKRIVEKLPLFALAVGVGWITIVVQGDAGAMASDAQVPLLFRLDNALVSYWIYIADTIRPSGLAIFYPHPMQGTPIWLAGIAALGLIVATGLCISTARKHPYLIVGWLWYLVTLVPVIGLIQVGMQARADRYLYLPQIGLTLALAWGARSTFASTPKGRSALALAGAAAIVALTGVAWRQTSYWRNTTTLYEHALEVTNENFVAHHGLAVELLDSGDPVAAEAHFERAVAIKPRWSSAHMGLGDARFEQGRVEEALVDYRRAIELAPRRPEGHLHIARALEAHGKPFRAIQHYSRAIALYETPNAYAHASLAALYARTNRLDPAEEHYRMAVALDPDFAEAHANLAFLLIRMRRFADARSSLDRALQLGLDSAEVHFAAGVVALEHDEPAEAVRHYRSALAKRPEWPDPANNLAWLLATDPDPDIREPLAAIEFAERLQGGGKQLDPDQLDTLAAAYAAAGRFPEAGVTAAAAAQLARDGGRPELALEIESRLRLYRAHRPFIETRRRSAP